MEKQPLKTRTIEVRIWFSRSRPLFAGWLTHCPPGALCREVLAISEELLGSTSSRGRGHDAVKKLVRCVFWP